MLVVASVSCIYGLGAPENYGSMHVYVEAGMPLVRDDLLALTALTGPERAPRGLGLSNRVLSLP